MLTPKQRRFVAEYLKDLNATQAAIRAGYKQPHSQGPRLLDNVEVAAAVEAGKAKQLARAELTADMVITELRRVALSNVQALYNQDGSLKAVLELDEDTARAVSTVEQHEEWGGDKESGHFALGGVKKMRMHDKLRALELLAKHFDLLNARLGAPVVNVQVQHEPTAEEVEELLRLSRELRVSLGRNREAPAPAGVAPKDEVHGTEADAPPGAVSPKQQP